MSPRNWFSCFFLLFSSHFFFLPPFETYRLHPLKFGWVARHFSFRFWSWYPFGLGLTGKQKERQSFFGYPYFQAPMSWFTQALPWHLDSRLIRDLIYGPLGHIMAPSFLRVAPFWWFEMETNWKLKRTLKAVVFPFLSPDRGANSNRPATHLMHFVSK